MTEVAGALPRAFSEGKEWRRIDRTLLSVQYLRAGAAVVVLVGHGWPQMNDWVMSILASVIDLFFLMSGFIVVMITDENTKPLEFARERIERIVPLYWSLTILCFVIIYSGVLEPDLNPFHLIGGLARADWEFLARSLVFYPSQSPFEPSAHPLIPQGWTLNYEMMFYALFAAALFLPKRSVIPALTAIFMGLVFVGAVSQPTRLDFQFWTSPLILEFIIGLWAGVAWRMNWSYLRFFAVVMVFWVPLVLVAFLFFADFPFYPTRVAWLPIVLAIFLAMIARDRARPQGLFDWPPFRIIGDASYSIYLAHFIPIILLDSIGRSYPVGEWTHFFVVCFGGLFAGLMAYYLLELPIMRHVKRMRKKRRAVASEAK